MDEIDRGILAALKANAREPFVEIAKTLGTSEGTIRARVKRLADDGVIRQFTIRTAGSAVKAMIGVRVATNADTAKIAGTISAMEGVERVWEVTGDNDVLVLVDVVSTSALNDLVERIRHVGGTESTRSQIVLKEW